jgi:hypothetical protein
VVDLRSLELGRVAVQSDVRNLRFDDRVRHDCVALLDAVVDRVRVRLLLRLLAWRLLGCLRVDDRELDEEAISWTDARKSFIHIFTSIYTL